jgi:HEPN domain-containing protein
MITNGSRIGYWKKHANHDYKIGYNAYEGGFYSHVTFMCHQVVEKTFKAAYVKIKNTNPPFTHDLKFLAVECGFWNNLTAEGQIFIDFLNPRQIVTRYPGEEPEGEEFEEPFTQEQALDVLDQTKNLQLWIHEKILSI